MLKRSVKTPDRRAGAFSSLSGYGSCTNVASVSGVTFISFSPNAKILSRVNSAVRAKKKILVVSSMKHCVEAISDGSVEN